MAPDLLNVLLNSRGADRPDKGPLGVRGEGGLNLTNEAVGDAVDAGLGGGGRLGGCPCRQNQPHRLTAAGRGPHSGAILTCLRRGGVYDNGLASLLVNVLDFLRLLVDRHPFFGGDLHDLLRRRAARGRHDL